MPLFPNAFKTWDFLRGNRCFPRLELWYKEEEEEKEKEDPTFTSLWFHILLLLLPLYIVVIHFSFLPDCKSIAGIISKVSKLITVLKQADKMLL